MKGIISSRRIVLRPKILGLIKILTRSHGLDFRRSIWKRMTGGSGVHGRRKAFGRCRCARFRRWTIRWSGAFVQLRFLGWERRMGSRWETDDFSDFGGPVPGRCRVRVNSLIPLQFLAGSLPVSRPPRPMTCMAFGGIHRSILRRPRVGRSD